MTAHPAPRIWPLILWLVAASAPLAGQRPVRLGGHLALGALSRDYARAAGGGLSFWWRRTPTIDAGFEARFFGFGVAELREDGLDGTTYVERSQRRIGIFTLAARRRYPRSDGADLYAAAGSGMYVLWEKTDFWTDPAIAPRHRSSTADKTFGVNVGGGFLLGQASGVALGVDLRAHVLIGGGSLLLGLATASLGVEW